MYKVIDLGCYVPETGEPRVRILDSSLVKTASSEMQEYWDGLEPSEDFSYLWVIGVSAAEYYGCNKNGDAFKEEELKNSHHRFVETANIFVQHVNRDPAKGIGKPVYSWYNTDMHRVEMVLAIDKRKPGAAEVVAKISAGEQLYVSMGCNVAYDVCSICGNKAPSRAAYCDHLRYNMKKILDDGRQVFAWNPNPQFFDISIVRRPADPTAFALDKIASEGGADDVAVLSAELGDRVVALQQKLAAIDKLSDILKSVDGIVVDSKDTDGEHFRYTEEEKERLDHDLYHEGFLDALRLVGLTRHGGFEDITPDYDRIDALGVSPAGFFGMLRVNGIRPTIPDAVFIGARHVLGPGVIGVEAVHDLLGFVPASLAMLRSKPELVDSLIDSVFGDYRGEFADRGVADKLLALLSSVSNARGAVLDGFRSRLTKEAFEPGRSFAVPSPVERRGIGLNLYEDAVTQGSTMRQAFKQLHFTDRFGNKIVTTPNDLYAGTSAAVAKKLISGKTAAAIMLAIGATALAASCPDLLSKASVLAAGAIPAAAVAFGGPKETTLTSAEGVEVPVSTITQSMYKSAEALGGKLSFAAGASLPALLATDYAINNWRTGGQYGYDPDNHAVNKLLYSAGEAVSDNPATTIVGAGIGAATAYHLLKNRRLAGLKNSLRSQAGGKRRA